MSLPTMVKTSFKQHMLQAREEAIVQTVNRLLAEKGFEAMTVDEVAARVGIAKASLYKHFSSKEDLAAAAMVRLLQRAQAALQALPPLAAPIENLRGAVRWMLEVKLAGDMPTLPSQNSSLRTTLQAHRAYRDGLIAVSDQLGRWIEAAQARGELNPALPALVILYTLYARACDPVLEFLKRDGRYAEADIVDMVMCTCFEGINAR